MKPRFEEVEHTADLALRIRGRTLADLFANAAQGMAAQIAKAQDVAPTVEEWIELEAEDAETLLVSWLGELLFLGERHRCVFTDFDMTEVTETRLEARARGGTAGERLGHIKAVTFSELKIAQSEEGFETTVVFDV
jgi:SHS2 domain-containing protein